VTELPAVTEVTPLVFVIPKLADGVSVSESVALLLPGVGSMIPPPVDTVAVLDRVPVAEAEIVALTV
jgi:hypothetical protein